MYQVDEKLTMFMDKDLWDKHIKKAISKGISKSVLSKCCKAGFRRDFSELMLLDRYRIAPPHIGEIEKDNGKMREVHINEPFDRLWLSIANDVYSKLYAHKIHKQCVSYQEGIGVPMIVKELANKLSKMPSNRIAGVKIDFKSYFDSLNKPTLYKMLDDMDTGSCIDTIVQEYYRDDHIINKEKQYVEHYKSIAQGCALGGLLANMALYEIDKHISNMDVIYYRYSDDVVIIGKEWRKAMKYLYKEIKKYGVTINPNKVEYIRPNKWFIFLGFSIKKGKISVSKKKLKTFRHEIKIRTTTLNKENVRPCTEQEVRAAIKSIMKYLYEPLKDTNYGWDEYIFSAINCEEDIIAMDEYVKDSIKAMLTNRRMIGGIGYQYTLPNGVIHRGHGKNVSVNSERTCNLAELGYDSMHHRYLMYKNNKHAYRAYKRRIDICM